MACGSGGELRSNAEDSFAYHYNLGMAAFEKKDYPAAIKHFKRSIQLNPNIARTHNELGVCYLYMRDYDSAIPSFERAIELDPNLAEAHNSLGVSYFSLGRLQEAELQFRATLSSPDYGTKFIPLFNLGNIYQMQKRYELALQTYQSALQDEALITLEYRININHQMGKTLFSLERYREAIDRFDNALVLNPRLVEAAFDAGRAAFLLGDLDKARMMFSRVVSIAPGTDWETKAREYLLRMER